ncbi:MAG: efflux RND transporter permease subunit [Metallibacterium scheffleri]|jgi:multidrug efflux pump subunit AcrB|uniref:efflux RND transporter permease subunit n=1 Tax=Metallibacterium scheffleri TaxID=993689 RepID=UPI0026F370D9|nr:efflux RND transporter permease subunit [Metallibacterium scheffleri]MCK9365914.1 efflux RND transporter permease subunit [Metallibacterium scheffleri]
MMRRYLAFLWLNRWSVILSALLLLGAGWYALRTLPESIFPDIDFPKVTVLVNAGNLPVRAMEDEVTLPLEEAAKGEPGVRLVRSQTGYGLSKLHVYFDQGVNAQTAYLMLQARLAHIALPPGATMSVHLMTPNVFPFAEYALVSNQRDSSALMPTFAFHLRPALLGIDGVYRVVWTGRGWPEVKIALNARRLAEHDLTAAQVVGALQAAQGPYFSGVLQSYNQQFVVATTPRPATAAALEKLLLPLGPVGVDGSRMPLALGALGTVTIAPPPLQRDAAVAGWRHALLVDIQAQAGANEVAVARAVQARIASLRAQLPAGVELVRIYDLSGLISGSLRDVWIALGLGSVITLLVVLLFLGRVDGALAVLTVVPLSLAAAFLTLHVLGYGLNIMTLGGLAAAIGALVDHAIVVIERGLHDLGGEREQRRAQALQRIGEILPIMSMATLTSVLVFLPLIFLSGTLGLLFRSMAVAIVIALLVSQLMALLVTPVLALWLAGRARTYAPSRRQQRAQRRYGRWLIAGTRRAWLVVPLMLVLAAAGWFTLRALPTAFLPHWDEGVISVPYRTQVGSSVAETTAVGRTLLHVALRNPAVARASLVVGRGFSNAYATPNKGALAIVLKPQRSVGTRTVMRQLSAAFRQAVPSLLMEHPTQVMVNRLGDLSGSHAPLEVFLFGSDPALLHAAGERLAQALKHSGAFSEVVFKSPSAGPEIALTPRAQASLYGLTPLALSQQVEARLWGRSAGMLLRGEQILPLRVVESMPSPAPGAVANLPLRLPGGAQVPLDQLARVQLHGVVPYVTHQNLVPYAYMWLQPRAGEGLAQAAARARTVLASMHFPASISSVIGGYYQQQSRSFRQMAMILAAALGALLVLLGLQFSSQRAGIAAMLAIALAAPGALLALWLLRIDLDSTAFLGMLLVFAIAVNNVILIFARARQLSGGAPRVAMVVLAARQRLRPILMTMLADVLGFLPLAIGIGRGTDLLRPLAVAVMGGLLLSILMSLGLAPILFSALAGWRGRHAAASGAAAAR